MSLKAVCEQMERTSPGRKVCCSVWTDTRPNFLKKTEPFLKTLKTITISLVLC